LPWTYGEIKRELIAGYGEKIEELKQVHYGEQIGERSFLAQS
jgi:hypothetical protein